MGHGAQSMRGFVFVVSVQSRHDCILSNALCAVDFWRCLYVCCVGKFDIKVSAPKLGIELLVSEHATTTLKGKKVGREGIGWCGLVS